MTTLDRNVETALKKYDEAVEWHSYSPHNVDREGAQHRAAAVLAEAVRDALSSLPAQAVGVKALEWNETSWQNDIAIRWTSSGPFHLLIKRNIGDQWFTYDGRHLATLDEAKAAAQADYEARILSALLAPSQPAAVGVTDERVDRAARALSVWKIKPGMAGYRMAARDMLEAALRSTP